MHDEPVPQPQNRPAEYEVPWTPLVWQDIVTDDDQISVEPIPDQETQSITKVNRRDSGYFQQDFIGSRKSR